MTLAYVGIRVRDLERSLRFYVDALGLQERKRGTMSHGGVFVELVDPVSHLPLELNWYPPGSPYAVRYVAGQGLDHLGFEVADARATIRELLRHGGRLAVEPWLERGRSWIGFVKDPDGIWIELESPAGEPASAPSTSS